MKYNKSFLVLVILAIGLQLNAQIGYQVSLLNSATGEPRANETVSVEVEITNSENTVICSETKSATTNEFGVLSLQIGNASTFANVDWSKLPLYVSATVDGIMVGKSQILNVPVAEAARTLVNVSPDLICKTWSGDVMNMRNEYGGTMSITLSHDMSFIYRYVEGDVVRWVLSGTFEIIGSFIMLYGESDVTLPAILKFHNGHLYGNLGLGYVKLD